MALNDPIQLLIQAAEEVLGTMFFAFVDPVFSVEDLEEVPVLSPAVHSRLGFKGPIEGNVQVFCPLNLARDLSADFLGQEESEVTEEMVLDAVKEITNMVTGLFLALIEPQRVCDLGLPHIELDDSVDLGRFFERPDSAVVLDTGEGVLAFDLLLETGK